MEETFTVDRSAMSISDDRINTEPEIAPHTLFTQVDPTTNVHKLERLEIRAFCDNSVLEVFVNERVVITSRLYSTSSRCFGLSFWAESTGMDGDDDLGAQIEKCRAWDGIGA